MTERHVGAPQVGAPLGFVVIGSWWTSWWTSCWTSMRRATGARPLRTARGSQLFVLVILIMVPGAVMIGPLLLEVLERKIGGTR